MAADNDPPTDPQALPQPPSLPDIRREREHADGFWDGTHQPEPQRPRSTDEHRQHAAPSPGKGQTPPRRHTRARSAAQSFWDGEIALPLDPGARDAQRVAAKGQLLPGSPIPIRRSKNPGASPSRSTPQRRKPPEAER